jgi:hypothetical protein
MRDPKLVIQAYFHGLENGSYSEVIKLFSSNAVVYSPLYGKISAAQFYKDLFADTQSSSISLKNVFISADNPYIAAAQFVYSWVLKDGTPVRFECVDIFDFSLESGLIQTLTIIYDTYHTRKDFSKIKNS